MAKMSELDAALTALVEHCRGAQEAAQDIKALLTACTDATAEAQQSEKDEAPQEPEKVWKLEDVRAVLKKKRDLGYVDEVKALLKAHGAARLPDIDPGEYPAMMKEAEDIGA